MVWVHELANALRTGRTKNIAMNTAQPYNRSMQTVIETHAYLKAAAAAGMTEDEMKLAVDTVSADPTTGDLIKGSGGCRKVRIAGRGKGKSGGYRVVTFFAPEGGQGVFLLHVLSKGRVANLTQAQVNALSTVTALLKGGSG